MRTAIIALCITYSVTYFYSVAVYQTSSNLASDNTTIPIAYFIKRSFQGPYSLKISCCLQFFEFQSITTADWLSHLGVGLDLVL